MKPTTFPIVIFFIGLLGFLGYMALQSGRQQSYAHDHYQPVDAVITRSEISCGSRRHSRCAPIVEYKYNVAGQAHTSTRYAFVSRDEGTSKRLARFPVNMHVTAYVNPDNPDDAVLDNTVWSSSQVLGLFIPFLTTIAIVMIAWHVIKKRMRYRT